MKENPIEIIINDIEVEQAVVDAARLGVLSTLSHENVLGEISVELTNDSVIHEYNRHYRGVDRPTDVLSFPTSEGDTLICPPDEHLGDIMISVETAKRQGEEYGHSTEREVLFLAVHGALHILGYDHTRPEDEVIMLAKQREIIQRRD